MNIWIYNIWLSEIIL